MPRLAQINIAHLRAPIDSPLLAEFAAQLDSVNAQAESSPGFQWRLKDETGNATTLSLNSPFGANMLVNVSVWDDQDALKAFVYRNKSHTGPLKQRDQWFLPMNSPHVALWWLNDNQLPTLPDAKRRLDHLAENSDTAYAFTFKKLFSAADAIAAPSHIQYLLRLSDDALVHSQRISEWCGHGPILEEDMALANVALDYLGQARLLYAQIGRIEGRSRTEDDLAYFRNDSEFFNSSLVELPNHSKFGGRDYSVAITKLFLHSAYMLLKWRALESSTDAHLAAVASKSIKETRYHFDHASQWMLRFGDGTTESNARAQAALNYLLPYCNEFFVDDDVDLAAFSAGLGPKNAELLPAWMASITAIVSKASLQMPIDSSFISRGKSGYHSESLSLLLAEMQSLARQHPGAAW
jgi:ring-1,2-phenylacetyl-CoA epoxidase subunit PaaC